MLRPTEEYARFKERIAAKLADKNGPAVADEQALREDAFGESEPVLGPVA